MYLAINYSQPAAELFRAGIIHVDYFKTPNWQWLVEEARQLRPVAVHFNLDAGNGSLLDMDWENIQQLAEATDTPYINLHLDSRQKYYPNYAVDTSIATEVEAVYKVILSDVMSVVNRFGAERVIIENSPYQERPGNTMRLCVEPGLISKVVHETGCGLLLDISHATISAQFLGMQPDEYITQLPVERVKELHFAGIHVDPATGKLTDHLSIQETDWPWLDWVIERIHLGEWNSPWLLAFEYGGVGEVFKSRSDPDVMLTQVPMLYEHIKLLNKEKL